MRVAIYQHDIVWENAVANLAKLERALERGEAEECDLLILPEMFNSGFCVEPQRVAETSDGVTIQVVKRLSRQFGLAICGSLAVEDSGRFFNRAFFAAPDGTVHFRDKKHLFSIGKEAEYYSAGTSNETISYMGWNIRLLVCYDLRFPVWSRNRRNEYDLLVYTANWPAARISSWDVLLPARAVENEAYVCGCNRIGLDGMGFPHSGHSAVFDYKGLPILEFDENEEAIKSISIDKAGLERFRSKFPAYEDADPFRFTEGFIE